MKKCLCAAALLGFVFVSSSLAAVSGYHGTYLSSFGLIKGIANQGAGRIATYVGPDGKTTIIVYLSEPQPGVSKKVSILRNVALKTSSPQIKASTGVSPFVGIFGGSPAALQYATSSFSSIFTSAPAIINDYPLMGDRSPYAGYHTITAGSRKIEFIVRSNPSTTLYPDFPATVSTVGFVEVVAYTKVGTSEIGGIGYINETTGTLSLAFSDGSKLVTTLVVGELNVTSGSGTLTVAGTPSAVTISGTTSGVGDVSTLNLFAEVQDAIATTGGTVEIGSAKAIAKNGVEGTVTGGIPVVSGQVLSAKATPAKGSVFAGWSVTNGEDAVTLTPVQFITPSLSFTASTNTVVSASFRTNPYSPVDGTYVGLVTATDPGTEEAPNQSSLNTGIATLSVTAAGGFSGSLKFAPGAVSFKGLINPNNGTGTVAIPATPAKGANPAIPALNLSFTIDSLTTTHGAVTGVITGPQVPFTSLSFTLGRPVFTGKTGSIHPLKGTYNIGLTTKTEHSNLAGRGYGVLTIDAKGAAKFAGTLADGSAFTASSLAGIEGEATIVPFAALPYSGKGVFAGTLVQDHSGFKAESIFWARGDNKAPFGAFQVFVKAAGGPWVAPLAGQEVFTRTLSSFDGNLELFLNGSLTPITAYSGTVIGTTANKLTFSTFSPGTLNFKAAVTTKTGAISGTFVDPFSTKSVKWTGLLVPGTTSTDISEVYGQWNTFTPPTAHAIGTGGIRISVVPVEE